MRFCTPWLIALPFLFLPAVTASAQDDDTTTTAYDYTRFRLQDIDRKALEIVPFMRHQGNSQTVRGNAPFTTRDHSLTQQFTADFSHFKNAKSFQALRRVEFTQGFARINRSNSASNADLVDRDFYSRIYTSGENRRFHHKNSFFELNWEAFASYQNSTFALSNSKLEQYAYFVRFPLKTGIGRVEPVDELFLAKFMLDDMLEVGIMDAPLPENLLFELGGVMAHARNQRIFDFRRQRQYEFSQLDNWFKDMGQARVDNILYYNTMADNWLYAFSNPRQNGRRIAVGIAPGYNYSAVNREVPDNYYYLAGTVEWSSFKPLNQYWQLDFTAEAEIAFIFYPRTEVFQPSLSLTMNAGYFPNSRTRIQTFASLNNSIYRVQQRNLHEFRPRAGADISYFLNYRMRLSANFTANYFWTSEANPNIFRPSIVPLPDRSRLQTISRVVFAYSIF